MGPVTELEWWASLQGDDIRLNTEGSPPYDAARVAGLVAARITPGRVLDVGCGTGRLAATYLALNPDCGLVGFDPSPQILAQAVARLPGCEFTATLPDGPFTGAYSVTVLQHLPAHECAQLVQAVGERLAPGGRFCFQYVEGTEDGFLSHQTSADTVRGWCTGFTLVAWEQDSEYPEWRWVTVQR